MGKISAESVTRAPTQTTKIVHAVCSHDCPDSCGVLISVDSLSGRAVKIQGDPVHPVTRGFLCGKVAKYLDRVYSPDRLLYPMRRKQGVAKGPLEQGTEAEVFERISWDEALDHIAGRLQDIATEFGPESILPYSYAGTIGQLGYGSMDRRFFHRLGATQLDRTICASAAGGEAAQARLRRQARNAATAGLRSTPASSSPGAPTSTATTCTCGRSSKRLAATARRLIVIDPYRTRTAALADEHLRHPPRHRRPAGAEQ